MTSKRVFMLLYVVALAAAAQFVSAELIDLSVRLDPQCAGAVSSGVGSGELRLDTEAGILSFDIGFSTEGAVVFSHIHGPIDDACGGGPSGGILYTFGGNTSPYVGTTADHTILDAQQIRDLIAGRYYINIHTDNYLDGEIRGRIELSLKSRYLTWHPSLVDDPRLTAGSLLGLRVTIAALPEFPAAEGSTLWVGPPGTFPEEDASAPGRTFAGAMLQCTPHLQDWSTLGALHVTAGEVMPDATYQFDLYDPACGDEADPACFFGTRIVGTARFADITTPLSVGAGTGQPDFRDVSAEVAKFVGHPDAPIKAVAHLVPNTPKSTDPIDFKTIAASVSAFVGVSYSNLSGITGPCACPPDVPCGTTCATDSECGAGLCVTGQCTGPCGRCLAP